MAATSEPLWKFPRLTFTAPLDQGRSPIEVGSGLTKANNLIYRRYGTWGKRPGSRIAYQATDEGDQFNHLNSAFRWYSGTPQQFTQLVVIAQGWLWTANDPGSKNNPANLHKQVNVTLAGDDPVDFTSVYDPSADSGNGSDILILCGLQGPYGFGTGEALFLGATGPGCVATVTATVKNGSAPAITTDAYQILETDNPTSVAQAVADLINQSVAVTGNAPFLGQCYVTTSPSGTAHLFLGALDSGTAGNSITFSLNTAGSFGTGSTFALGPTVTTSFTGGGSTVDAPCKWDGTTLSGLSYQVTHPFRHCVTWHNHVWLWGYAAQPDALYATDIDQPEGFTFMIQNGPYYINRGDGDPNIRACVPSGFWLYVFKGNSIHAVSGYDFQAGEYSFSVQPQVLGHGTVNASSVAVLRGSMIFWDGAELCRLAPGSFDVEHIGAPVSLFEGLASAGNQRRCRVAAGSFNVNTTLVGNLFSGGLNVDPTMLTNCAFFAFDFGNGATDQVLMYDDDASRSLGTYAWSHFTGWNVGFWVPFGYGSTSAAGTVIEQPQLFWIEPDARGQLVDLKLFGDYLGYDDDVPILFEAATGWMTTDTPALMKELHRINLEVNSARKLTINYKVLSPGYDQQGGEIVIPAPNAAYGETYSTNWQTISPQLKGRFFAMEFTENSGAACFELVGCTWEALEEPFKP